MFQGAKESRLVTPGKVSTFYHKHHNVGARKRCYDQTILKSSFACVQAFLMQIVPEVKQETTTMQIAWDIYHFILYDICPQAEHPLQSFIWNCATDQRALHIHVCLMRIVMLIRGRSNLLAILSQTYAGVFISILFICLLSITNFSKFQRLALPSTFCSECTHALWSSVPWLSQVLNVFTAAFLMCS